MSHEIVAAHPNISAVTGDIPAVTPDYKAVSPGYEAVNFLISAAHVEKAAIKI
jgi:hypothetical protein